MRVRRNLSARRFSDRPGRADTERSFDGIAVTRSLTDAERETDANGNPATDTHTDEGTDANAVAGLSVVRVDPG